MGCCCSHRSLFSYYSHPTKIPNVQDDDAVAICPMGKRILAENRSHVYDTVPDLTSDNTSTNSFPTTDKTPLLVSKLCLNELLPHDEQKLESSRKIHAHNLPIIGKKKECITIIRDKNSTTEDWAGECPSALKIYSKPNPASADISLTNLPPEIVEHLRKLMSTDNPAAKVLEGQLAEILSKSLDLNICIQETSVNISGESWAHPVAENWANSSRFAMDDGELGIRSCRSLTYSSVVSNESEILACLKTDSFDEKMQSSYDGMIQLSSQQLRRSSNISKKMFESLEKLTPLSKWLAKSSEEMQNDFSTTRRLHISQENQKHITEIDSLDAQIIQSSHKLSDLHKMSVNIITDTGPDTDSDHSLKYISIEKNISQLEGHKKKLVHEREQIIKKLISKLIQPIPVTSLASPKKGAFSFPSQATGVDLGLPSNHMKFDSTVKSFPALSNICMPEAEEDVIE